MRDFEVLVSLAGSIINDCQICLNNALREIGLGSAEANVLMFLYTNGDGVRQEDIVAATEVSKPAISRTVASLEAKGYITRRYDENDRRSRVVTLTGKARRDEAFIREQYADLVAAASQGISADKVSLFIDVFSQVAANVNAHRSARRS